MNINDEINFYPILIFIPNIKLFSLGNRYENTNAIYSSKLLDTVNKYKKQKISLEKCRDIFYKFENNLL